MEEKYKKFKEFDWQASQEWQLYYSNLYPTPGPSKIERFKKKFYKNKIDPDFDIDYKPPEDTSSNTSSSSQSHQQYTSYQPPQASVAINSPVLLNIETLVFFLFAFSLPFNFHSLKIVSLGLLLRTIRLCGKPQWKIEYAQILFTNETFQTLLSTLVLFIDRFNYYLMLPCGISVLVYVCENMKAMNNPMLNGFMGYIDTIVNKKTELIQCKAHVEVAIGFLLVIGFFFKINSFILPIIYWQLMKMKYVMNPNLQVSFHILNEKVNEIKNKPGVPPMAKMVIDKIQWAFEYMGKVEIPKEAQQGQQQAAGPSCIIF